MCRVSFVNLNYKIISIVFVHGEVVYMHNIGFHWGDRFEDILETVNQELCMSSVGPRALLRWN